MCVCGVSFILCVFCLTPLRAPTAPTQSGTVAAASAIASVAPHLAGAIDVIIVRQPDGSLRSSPW